MGRQWSVSAIPMSRQNCRIDTMKINKLLLILGVGLLSACSTIKYATPPSEPDAHIIKAKITPRQITIQSRQYQYVLHGISQKQHTHFQELIQNYQPHLAGGYLMLQDNKHSIYGNQFNNQLTLHYHIIINEKSLSPAQKHTLISTHRAKPYPSKNIYNTNTDKQLQVKFKADATRYLIDNLPKHEQLGNEYALATPIRFTHIGQNNTALHEVGAVALMPVYVIVMMFGCMTERCI